MFFTGLYELWILEHNSQSSKQFSVNLSDALTKMTSNLKGSQLCCAFESEFGNASASVVVWQHPSFDATKNLRNEWSTYGKFKKVFISQTMLKFILY